MRRWFCSLFRQRPVCPGPPLRTGEDMNREKAVTGAIAIVALLAIAALAVLPQPERNPYEVREVPAAVRVPPRTSGRQEAASTRTPFPPPPSHGCACPGRRSTIRSCKGGRIRPTSTSRTTPAARDPRGALPTSTPGARKAPRARSSSSTGTTCPTAPCSRRSRSTHDFAEGHHAICVYTRDEKIELEVFAVDVVDASSEGKRTDFADAADLDAYLGDKLSRCEVVLEEPADVAQAWAFVTCSYQTSNSRTVVYAKGVEIWDSRPSE